MKILKIFFFLFLLSVSVSAQQLEIWKNFTNTNDVRKIAVSGSSLWAVTSGGLYKYDLSNKNFTTYTKADGLSSQDLTALAVDKNGIIWVGSSEGYINALDPADGSVSKIYDIYNSSKSQKGINDLAASGDTLFVSHDFGLSLINVNSSEFMDNVTKFGSLSTESKVNSIFRTSQIYACLSEGFAVQIDGATNIFSPDSWTSYTYSSRQFNKAVSFNNKVYVATDAGLYIFSNGSFTLAGYSSEEILDLYVYNSSLYILSALNLYKYSTAFETVASSDDSNHNFTNIAQYSGDIYLSSNEGVKVVSSSGNSVITANAPITNSFMNMDVDASGNLWVGTGKDGYGKGIMKYDGSTWTNFYTSLDPEKLSDYHNVYAADDGTIYWMNWGQGFSTYANSAITRYNTLNTPMKGILADTTFLVISDVKRDDDGNTWFVNLWPADFNVLACLSSGNVWTTYTFSSISSSQIFYKLVIDKYSTKWVTVSANTEGGNKGIIAFNESSSNPIYQYYSSSDGLNSDVVNALAIDERGYIWIGTSSGINYISNPASPVIYTPYNVGIKYQNITSIAVDALDQKWIGTKSGVFILSSDCATQINHYETSNSPLPSNEITSIAIDKKNGIAYIGTDYGLTMLKTDFVEPQESFTELITYPAPFIVGDGKSTLLKIDGLIKESSLKILSLTGELISEFQSSGGRIAFWDGKNSNGNYVSSGVYFVIAFDQEGNNVAKGKFVVLRK